jgi:hypothetical protein
MEAHGYDTEAARVNISVWVNDIPALLATTTDKEAADSPIKLQRSKLSWTN